MIENHVFSAKRQYGDSYFLSSSLDYKRNNLYYIMQNQGELRIKCSIASGLNTDFDKGNQEIEITFLRNCKFVADFSFSSVLLFGSATGVRYSKYKE